MGRAVALVTGASAGLGVEFARQLAQAGNDLVLVARDRERLEQVAKQVEADHGVTAEVLVADLTDPAQLAAVEERVRTVDTLVNNAGFGTFGKFYELDLATELREVQLNIVALMCLTHAAAQAMAERGAGGILNVSSLAGFQCGPSNGTYSATKAFVTSFTEAVHQEMKGTGVKVTVLCPGFTRTEFQARANVPGEDVPGFLWQDPPIVVKTGLDGLAKNKAIVMPGALNKALGNFSDIAPRGLTRMLSGEILRRSGH
jgi:short-subunit dehydrogenase